MTLATIPAAERRAAFRAAANVLRIAHELDKLGLPRPSDDARVLEAAVPDVSTTPGAVVTFTPPTPPPVRTRRDVLAAARARATRPRPDRIHVGTCNAEDCGGPVFYSPAAGCACCPCGAVQIPAAFMVPPWAR
jgi:hypothetical protein